MLTDLQILPVNQPSDFDIKILGQDASAIGAKALYSLIMEGKDTVSTAFQRWTEDREEIRLENHEEWKDTFTSPFQATRETKLQSFHFKVVNRIFPCASYLCRIRIKDSDWCKYCDETDSVTLHLYRWAKVKPFWDAICNWFRQSTGLYLDELSAKEYIFGLPKGTHQRDNINAILLATKFYIYRQKLFHEGDLNICQWLLEFKMKLQTEKWIRKRTGLKPLSRCLDQVLYMLGWCCGPPRLFPLLFQMLHKSGCGGSITQNFCHLLNYGKWIQISIHCRRLKCKESIIQISIHCRRLKCKESIIPSITRC